MRNHLIKPTKLINTINLRNEYVNSKNTLHVNKTEENTNINNKKNFFFKNQNR
jgi:hypothetical protein